MGVTNVDNLPENTLVRVISDARQVDRERKGSTQRISGASLAYITSESSSTFDWSGRLDTMTFSGRGTAAFTITLTAATAIVPLADLAVIAYYSTDGVTWSEYTYARGWADSYNAVAPEMMRYLSVLQGTEVGPKTAVYSLLLYGTYNARFAFKLQAVGTDDLTIGVVRTT